MKLAPLEANQALKGRVYEALKQAITRMDMYSTPEPPRLDERRLAETLGVSRTPVREAISRLEQEGLVKTVARRGAFVVRKSKQEILDVVCVWAALESMAARLATQSATDADIASLRQMFTTFGESHEPSAHIDEYSESNIRFHQEIMRLSGCALLEKMADGLFIHMRSIRKSTIRDEDRARRSIIDHMRIIEAIEQRDTERAERLVREHALNLAKHVEQHVDYLD